MGGGGEGACGGVGAGEGVMLNWTYFSYRVESEGTRGTGAGRYVADNLELSYFDLLSLLEFNLTASSSRAKSFGHKLSLPALRDPHSSALSLDNTDAEVTDRKLPHTE